MTRLEFARQQNKLYKNDPTKIAKSARIDYDNVVIGKNCKIKSGAVIGYEGFGFERDENDIPFRISHIGKVVIGNNVEIGENTVISRGTVGNTVIGNNVKIDGSCFIAHNVWIGENTLIPAGVVICGSVTIGRNCWIGAGCRIKEKVNIGDNVTIGIGAVVIEDILAGATVAGIKAQSLQGMKNLAHFINNLS